MAHFHWAVQYSTEQYLSSLHFPPSLDRPGVWRKVEIDVILAQEKKQHIK